jgi:hypothetical protein
MKETHQRNTSIKTDYHMLSLMNDIIATLQRLALPASVLTKQAMR